jgi:SAM-dependent methyltransferase
MSDQGLEAFFDQTQLRADAYVDSKKVMARGDIYRYAVPGIPFREWALSHLPDDLGMLLDVGCGPGLYLREIADAGRATSLIGIDLSDGMLREVEATASLCLADAQHLPIRTDSIDTAICMHVLYHVPDISLAVAEFRRVVKEGGHLLVATNAEDHQGAIRELFDGALRDLTGDTSPDVLASVRRFRLEIAGEILGRRFASVERFDLVQEIVVPDVEPVVRYVESIRSFHESRLPEGVGWDDVVSAVREMTKETIASEGAFRSVVHPGILVCR